jgi:hypothetical protein
MGYNQQQMESKILLKIICRQNLARAANDVKNFTVWAAMESQNTSNVQSSSMVKKISSWKDSSSLTQD